MEFTYLPKICICDFLYLIYVNAQEINNGRGAEGRTGRTRSTPHTLHYITLHYITLHYIILMLIYYRKHLFL
jgi:hypothetical protein